VSRCAATTGRWSGSEKRARPPPPSAISLRALVSIGTNSTRLLIVDGDRTHTAESRGTRLGTGIAERGALDPAARERTLAAIADYMTIVRGAGASVDCIATSVMRRADDGADFARAVEDLVGVAPVILSGEEEATFSFLGATRQSAAAAPVGVLDVGGGSSELAVDVPSRARALGTVAQTLSIEIGAVRLSERYPALMGAAALDSAARAALVSTAEADARSVLAPMASLGPIDHLIVVGGTAFTAAAMIAQAPLRAGVTIDAAGRSALLDQLLGRDLHARRALPFIRPQRADILPAGIIAIDVVCRLLGVDAVTVSDDDLLAGYLYSDRYRATRRP
jgi:exopolyphosphatase / guanosine-5'-triphosphate,3'-diphosphate pyrophosphatase